MQDLIERLEASASYAERRALSERNREYSGVGETPAVIAAYWAQQAASARRTLELLYQRGQDRA